MPAHQELDSNNDESMWGIRHDAKRYQWLNDHPDAVMVGI